MHSIFDAHIVESRNVWRQQPPLALMISERVRKTPDTASGHVRLPASPASPSPALFRLPPWIVPDDREVLKKIEQDSAHD